MASDRRHLFKRRKDAERHSESSPDARPFELTPVELRDEPAREVPSIAFDSRETPLREVQDTAAAARQVDELRFEARPVGEIAFELRQEQERAFQLRDVPVSEVEMRELRERRFAARDLGWAIPGSRVRIATEDSPVDHDQASSTNSRSK